MDRREKRWQEIEQGIVPGGYKRTEIGIIPQSWEVARLGDLADIQLTKTSSGEQSVQLTAKNQKMQTAYLNKIVARSSRFKSELRQREHDKVSWDDFLLPLPSIEEQKKILAVIGGLEEKQKSLEVMRRTLETEKTEMEQKWLFDAIQMPRESAPSRLNRSDSSTTQFMTFQHNTDRIPGTRHKKLGEVANIYNGLQGKRKEDFKKGGAVFLPYKNVFNNNKVDLNYLETVHISPGEKQEAIQTGDIFITKSSENREGIGKSAILSEEIKTPCYLNSFCFGIRMSPSSDLEPEFIFTYLNSKKIRENIMRVAQGATRFNLNKSELETLDIPVLPPAHREKTTNYIESTLEKAKSLEEEARLLKEQSAVILDEVLFGHVKPEDLNGSLK